MNSGNSSSRDSGGQLVLERFLPYRLSILSNTVSNTIAREYRDRFGLSVSEWRVMAVLGRFGPMSAGDACERTAMDKVTVSRAVSNLIAQKFIKRQVDSADRRRSILRLTQKGVKTHAQIVPIARSRESALETVLNEQEQRDLDALLTKLQNRADEIASGQTGT